MRHRGKLFSLYSFYSLPILFLLLAGCANLERNFPERNYYILNIPKSNPTSAPVSKTVLEVRRFTISPNFTGREFVYRKGENSYVADFYNQFFRTPSLLITEETHKWLSESGLFKYVVDSTNSVRPDYVLAGNINGLYGDYRTSDSPRAVVGIQFFLTDETSANSQIIFRNNYRREVVLRDNSPETLVEGWNEALGQIFTALEEDVNRLDLDNEND
jgi:ABC-type uncharacterized transport system auxiliary subunit